MICRLCLLDATEIIDIYGSEGIELGIAPIISEHFWFEPKIGDFIPNVICNCCWWKLDSFHVFYLSIKEAHERLIEANQVKEIEYDSQVICKKEVDVNFSDADSVKSVETIGVVNTEATSDNVIEPKEEIKPLEDSSKEVSNVDPDSEQDETFVRRITRQSRQLATKREMLEEKGNFEKKSRKVPKALKLKSSKRIKKIGKSGNNVDNYENSERNATKEERQRKIVKSESEYLKKSKEDDEKIAKYMKLKCELCGLGFTIFAEIRKHYRMAHKRKGYVVCCNKKLYKRVLILDHINKHLNPEYFKCDECNKTFSDKQCLKNHMIRHESEDVKIYKCEQCPRRYARPYLLEQHKLIHMPQEERQYFCDECGKAFPTKNLLQTHKRYVHENAYGKMCHICAKVIKGKALFEKHQLEHDGIIEPKVQCQQCGAWLKHEYSLKKHMRRHQEELSEHVCNMCGKTAPSKGALRSHIRYVHASERSFQCSVCDKGFKKALTLKEHMTTHTGEVLYTCPHCPKTFNHSANMHSHRKKVHRQEWEEGRKNRGVPQDSMDNTSADEKSVSIFYEASIETMEENKEKRRNRKVLQEYMNNASPDEKSASILYEASINTMEGNEEERKNRGVPQEYINNISVDEKSISIFYEPSIQTMSENNISSETILPDEANT